MLAESAAFTTWLDRFFDSYYKHRPVNGTFIGVHDGDHRLPDSPTYPTTERATPSPTPRAS